MLHPLSWYFCCAHLTSTCPDDFYHCLLFPDCLLGNTKEQVSAWVRNKFAAVILEGGGNDASKHVVFVYGTNLSTYVWFDRCKIKEASLFSQYQEAMTKCEVYFWCFISVFSIFAEWKIFYDWLLYTKLEKKMEWANQRSYTEMAQTVHELICQSCRLIINWSFYF